MRDVSHWEDGMAKTGARWIIIYCVSALAISSIGGLAESDALVATVDKPATFTVPRPPSVPATSTAASPRPPPTISVTSYRPTQDCTPVEAVVPAPTAPPPSLHAARL